MHYPVIIHKDQESCFGLTIPDWGAFTAGDSPEEAMGHVQEVLEAMHEAAPRQGPPPASSLEAVARSEEAAGGWLALVDVDLTFLSTRTRPVNITVPDFAVRIIDQAARRSGKTRSRFLVDAALKEAQGDPG
jgi:predicted RNase H-like HicB family nuclease